MPIEQIIQAKLAALPTPVPPEEHIANVSYMAPEAGNFIEYQDWCQAGADEDDTICAAAIAFCFMPEKFFFLMQQAVEHASPKEFLMVCDPLAVRELAVRFLVYLTLIEDDGESDPTAPALRPKPKGGKGPGYGY